MGESQQRSQASKFSVAPDGTVDQKTVELTSKALSKVLRHSAAEDGVTIYPGGWAEVSEVKDALSNLPLQTNFIFEVVTRSRRNGVPRFEMKSTAEGIWIRAKGKHTMTGVDPQENADWGDW